MAKARKIIEDNGINLEAAREAARQRAANGKPNSTAAENLANQKEILQRLVAIESSVRKIDSRISGAEEAVELPVELPEVEDHPKEEPVLAEAVAPSEVLPTADEEAAHPVDEKKTVEDNSPTA